MFELDPDPYSRFSRVNAEEPEDASETERITMETIQAFASPRNLSQTQDQNQSIHNQIIKTTNSQNEIKGGQSSALKKKFDVGDLEISKQGPRPRIGHQNIKVQTGGLNSPKRRTLTCGWSPFSSASLKSPYAIPLPRSKRVVPAQATSDKRMNSKKRRS